MTTVHFIGELMGFLGFNTSDNIIENIEYIHLFRLNTGRIQFNFVEYHFIDELSLGSGWLLVMTVNELDRDSFSRKNVNSVLRFSFCKPHNNFNN